MRRHHSRSYERRSEMSDNIIREVGRGHKERSQGIFNSEKGSPNYKSSSNCDSSPYESCKKYPRKYRQKNEDCYDSSQSDSDTDTLVVKNKSSGRSQENPNRRYLSTETLNYLRLLLNKSSSPQGKLSSGNHSDWTSSKEQKSKSTDDSGMSQKKSKIKHEENSESSSSNLNLSHLFDCPESSDVENKPLVNISRGSNKSKSLISSNVSLLDRSSSNPLVESVESNSDCSLKCEKEQQYVRKACKRKRKSEGASYSRPKRTKKRHMEFPISDCTSDYSMIDHLTEKPKERISYVSPTHRHGIVRVYEGDVGHSRNNSTHTPGESESTSYFEYSSEKRNSSLRSISSWSYGRTKSFDRSRLIASTYGSSSSGLSYDSKSICERNIFKKIQGTRLYSPLVDIESIAEDIDKRIMGKHDDWVQAQKRHIYILGDSHTRFLVFGLQHILPGFVVESFCKPSAKSEQVLYGMEKTIGALTKTDFLIIICGTNDTFQGSVRNAKTCIEQTLKNSENTNILLCTLPQNYSVQSDSHVLEDRRSLNKFIKRVSKEFKNYVKVVNLSKLKNKDFFTKHGLHFNTTGKIKICELISHKLLDILDKMNENHCF